MIAAAAFYAFALLLIGSALMVVASRNPVHSVLFLILAFFNAAALFLLAGAEFLAMILVIVYVGAVAVLFLFVVMMLDINFAELRSGFQNYKLVGAGIGAVLLLELIGLMWGWRFAPAAATLRFAPTVPGVHNTVQIGRLLYTDYILLFQTAGLVLLVAMIGAIVLTLRGRVTTRRQNIAQQVARTAGSTVELMDLAIGAGTTALGGFLHPKVTEEVAAGDDEHESHGAHERHDHAHGGGH
jgi:NADH-quinone oxidoreductase subunit J